MLKSAARIENHRLRLSQDVVDATLTNICSSDWVEPGRSENIGEFLDGLSQPFQHAKHSIDLSDQRHAAVADNISPFKIGGQNPLAEPVKFDP